jgi:hypothetical protein
MKFTLPLLFTFLPLLLAAAQQVSVEMKFVELDEADYEVVKAELLATRLPGDFEGLKRSQVPAGFWAKVQTFPGAEILSAPKLLVLEGSEATIEVGDVVKVGLVCEVRAKGTGVDIEAKFPQWKKGMKTEVTLPDGIQAMLGSVSNEEGRRILLLCMVKAGG